MNIMNNYDALYPLITLHNALYIQALSKVLPMFLPELLFPLHLKLMNTFKNW